MKYKVILSEEQLEILDVALIGAKFYYEKQIRFDTKYYVQLLKEISELHNEVEKAVVPADVRPVVRGEWLPYEFGDYHWHKCSACGVADKYIETIKRDGFTDVDLESVRNFCPNCGADMRNSESTSI